ncbi:uncharacterized protein PFL1_01755 [Pseudozyma flocculosa PF-1]|uniref:uncharacterized protein n=1 Tax=Pseudozyma flocculosa PF-1 TaxID=1277687 RepID=UPI0004560EDD|nr:uncharacterized protein PFL1_01755 [Pseudozyma flocculosa PF-1]EPQ30858.1 hypothetical protein PFL1_01755 [Pseudozyma flocculosa PF-1]
MELKILSATSPDLFLQPRPRSSPSQDDHERDPSAYLQVIIQLSIPKDSTPPAKLLSLNVSLVGYESIGFPRGGFEQNQPYCSKVAIPEAADLRLEPGSLYQFETTFAVDHNTAPYQRGKYGRHHQKVHVKATFPGLFGKKTLDAERNFFFIQTVMQSGSLPYYYVHRSAADALGPIFFGVRTQHLTVGGYLRITFSLASASPTVRLHSLKLALLQQTTLKSRVRRNYAEQPPLERFPFFEAGDEELGACITAPTADGSPDGQDATLREGNWIARLPSDSEARASSLPGGDVAIHMAHALELVIQYSDPTVHDGEVQTYRASWGLILPSCACRWQSMRLPSYTTHDSNPVPKTSRDFWTGRNEHESHSQCVCGETLETLLQFEEEAKKAKEPEAESEIWRQMLDMRLQQRLAMAARGRNGGRSVSNSPAVSRDISRRNSHEDVRPSSSSSSQPGTPSGGAAGTAGGEQRGRTGSRLVDQVRLGLLDDEDELEFELQARELLEGLEGQQWQREWDRLQEQRQRRAKARNEYINLANARAAQDAAGSGPASSDGGGVGGGGASAATATTAPSDPSAAGSTTATAIQQQQQPQQHQQAQKSTGTTSSPALRFFQMRSGSSHSNSSR